MSKFFILIFFILSSFFSFGQTVALDNFCLNYLGERANSLKVKTYAVRVDEMEGSIIVLKKEQGSVKGVLFFPKEKKALLMTGSDKTLYLRDNNGFDHGTMNYTADNQEFTGVLTSSLEHKISNIRGLFTKDVPIIPPACYVDKWLVTHRGTIGEEPILLYLQRIGNGDLQGLIYFSRKKKSFFLSGISVRQKIDLMMTNKQGNKTGDIKGTIKEDGSLSANFTARNGAQEMILTQPIFSDEQNCNANISTDFRYSIIYPKLEIPVFDKAMDNNAFSWINRWKADNNKATSLKRKTLLNSPSAYSYTRIHCRDNQYFSGYQIAYLPTEDRYEVKGINFDIRKKKFLSLEDLFSSPKDILNLVKVRILKSIHTHPLKDYKEFVKWMSNASFNHFVIQPDGILFSSNFHPIYGQQHVLFSYAELKPFMKNKKIRKHFRKLK